jgi:16S rRNA (cytosine1402-N4)-methyltransferase
MEATMVSDTLKHYPVLLDELISIITPQHGGTFIDCTFGQGGYTKKILSFKNTQVIALDRDIESKKKADKISKEFENRFIFKNKKFSQLDNLKLKNENIRGVLFDLGYSFTQIKDSKKGLSFNSSGSLDMRMGLNEFSAKETVNKLDGKSLVKIFKSFGDEKDAKLIVKNILKERLLKEIDTPHLVRIIENSKKRNSKKTHPATKVFQALRIFVNKEISELIYGMIHAVKVLKKDGLLVVVTFHSLEDKIVKYFFRSLSEHKSVSRYQPEEIRDEILFKLHQKKPIVPSNQELKENYPSRSAKLRCLIKKENFYDFKTDILDKFKDLIEIENLDLEL